MSDSIWLPTGYDDLPLRPGGHWLNDVLDVLDQMRRDQLTTALRHTPAGLQILAPTQDGCLTVTYTRQGQIEVEHFVSTGVRLGQPAIAEAMLFTIPRGDETE